ncbi:MAG: head-tail adaptor protein [Oscillospiraceae bacterium]|nr:head-tail adaptor protein [Oscillospiraceae bacterium]
MTYDKPVVIQKQNQTTEEWKTVLCLHARVNKTGGSQTFAADAEQFHARLNFDLRYCRALEKIRYQPQIYRLLYRNHHFQVIDYDDYQEQHKTVRIVGVLYE